MTWKQNQVRWGKCKGASSEARKQDAEDRKCPKCGRKSAVKFISYAKSPLVTILWKLKCRWCDYHEDGPIKGG
jgi:hypothetical protein